MAQVSPTPTFDNVRLDTGIDPKDQQSHDARVAYILNKYPSQLLDRKGNIRKPVKGGHPRRGR